MERQEFTRKFLAGLFFAGGMALIVFFIFMIGRDKGLAQPKFPVVVLYKNIGGLMEGAPTRLAGVTVGNVARIDFLDEAVEGRRVQVTLNIFGKYRRQLRKILSFAIKTEGILGEKLVEIDVLAESPAMDLSRPVMGEEPLDVQDMAEVFAEAARAFSETTERLNQVDILGLTEVMGKSSESLLITSEGVNEILDELQEMTRKSNRLLDRIEQRVIDGNLFKVF
jgi:ABC-type transporter Mla subunit MlaD